MSDVMDIEHSTVRRITEKIPELMQMYFSVQFLLTTLHTELELPPFPQIRSKSSDSLNYDWPEYWGQYFSFWAFSTEKN